MPAILLAFVAPFLGKLKTYAVLGAVAIFALGFAYTKGRIDGRAFERAEAMAAAEAVRKRDEIANAQLEADNRREIEQEVARELSNDEIEARLLRPDVLDSAPALNGEFMHNLGRLR